MMRRLPWFVFVLMIFASIGYLTMTTPQLPARVASHFGSNNLANGWMLRADYLRFMLAVGVLLPVMLTLLTAWLPRVAPGFVNLPHRDYWMAPERRGATLARLSAHGAWFGILLSSFFVALHGLLLKANALTPPQLPMPEFWLVLGFFVCTTIVWMIRLVKPFRNIV